MKITIAVITHKKYEIPTHSPYLPMLVGNNTISERNYIKDNIGDNISSKNQTFCELTGLYWIWKNMPDNDALGIVHYRRHFKGKNKIASESEISSLLENHDCILPKKRNYFIESTYSQYAHAHHAVDLDTTRGIIAERCPEFIPAFDKTMKSPKGHRFNMMVMKKPLFDDYCAWLFDILFELEKRLDVSTYSTYDLRVFGFVAERILDVYIETKKIKYAELPVLNLESQHWPTKIMRFLRRKFTARR